MGIICVAFVELSPTEARIPVFVLSCRVFGYGFETVCSMRSSTWRRSNDERTSRRISSGSTRRHPSISRAAECILTMGSPGAMECGSFRGRRSWPILHGWKFATRSHPESRGPGKRAASR